MMLSLQSLVKEMECHYGKWLRENVPEVVLRRVVKPQFDKKNEQLSPYPKIKL